MIRKVKSEEKDSVKESVKRVFAQMNLHGFEMFRTEALLDDKRVEFQATLSENGLTKTRARIVALCVAPGKLQVDVFLSENKKSIRHFRVLMKNDCNCQEFQVLEHGKSRAISSLSGTFTTT
jgi:hypothetical protein